jgi:hypothetical protein
MRRREFIAGLAGAAAWPATAWAQQPQRMRRIGVLMTLAADDPEAPTRIGAFLQGMQEFGWTIGRNIRIDYRWSPDVNSIFRYATELVALAPRHLSECQPERRGIATRNALHTDRICGGHRSSGRHVRRKLGATWQQCYRL